jgi:phage terminase small subunit
MGTNDKEIKLTPKQEQFCYEYLANGFNATKAAIKAGYAKKTAYAIGAENLKKPQIKARIQEMKDNLAETAGITALMIAKEHQKIAFSSHAKLRDGWMKLKDFEELDEDIKDCIQEVTTKRVKKHVQKGQPPEEETYVRVKTYDKQKSLEALATMLGFNAPTKQEITGKDGADIFMQLLKSSGE